MGFGFGGLRGFGLVAYSAENFRSGGKNAAGALRKMRRLPRRRRTLRLRKMKTRTATEHSPQTVTEHSAQTVAGHSPQTVAEHSAQTIAGNSRRAGGYYRRHVFVCENKREEGDCCANGGSLRAVKILRALLKEKGMHGAGKIRVNRAGCFDRCALGPVMVVYPDGVWYRYKSDDDLREIAERHLFGGETVERLRLPDTSAKTNAAATVTAKTTVAKKQPGANA